LLFGFVMTSSTSISSRTSFAPNALVGEGSAGCWAFRDRVDRRGGSDITPMGLDRVAIANPVFHQGPNVSMVEMQVGFEIKERM